jgi:hypothetical protein
VEAAGNRDPLYLATPSGLGVLRALVHAETIPRGDVLCVDGQGRVFDLQQAGPLCLLNGPKHEGPLKRVHQTIERNASFRQVQGALAELKAALAELNEALGVLPTITGTLSPQGVAGLARLLRAALRYGQVRLSQVVKPIRTRDSLRPHQDLDDTFRDCLHSALRKAGE